MMKKRFFSLLAAGALVFTLAAPAGAERLPSVQVDGTALSCVPQLVAGRSYLPREELAAALGAESVREGDAVTLTRNGERVTLPVAYEQGGEAYLPLRAAGAALGYSVGWDRESRTVLLVDLTPLTGEKPARKDWYLAETTVRAGALTAGLEGYGEQLAELVDPACLLSAIPLTDAGTACRLLTLAAEAMDREGETQLVLGDTVAVLDREGGETRLTLSLPAGEVLPAERLGLEEETVAVKLWTGEREAHVLATVGDWQFSARWELG